jgi:hypothetical protein
MAAGRGFGVNCAIASRFDWPGAWSDGSGGTGAGAAGGSIAAGAGIIGLLVSRTTLSGHLRSDLIRMAALSMTSGRSEKRAGVSRNDQLAINSRTASAAPTTTKYLTMGTADASRDFSNRGQPMPALLDDTHVAPPTSTEDDRRLN